jgi:arsenate reductase
MDKMEKKVLFLCTGNASRSQMAEGLANHDFGDRIRAWSAGTDPKGVSPLAVRVLAEIDIDISAATSDHLSRYAEERFDYVITLCDDANERCPVFFGGVKRLHMSFPDPPHSDVPSEDNMKMYRQVRDAIRSRLTAFFRAELQDGTGRI